MTDGADLVEVAPREITDVVYYCCRVAGVDPGTAHLIADNVTAAEIAEPGAVADFASTLDNARPELTAELVNQWAVDGFDIGVGSAQFGERRSQVMRQGLHVPADVLAVLKSTSSRFLVSEAAVDAAVAESGKGPE